MEVYLRIFLKSMKVKQLLLHWEKLLYCYIARVGWSLVNWESQTNPPTHKKTRVFGGKQIWEWRATSQLPWIRKRGVGDPSLHLNPKWGRLGKPSQLEESADSGVSPVKNGDKKATPITGGKVTGMTMVISPLMRKSFVTLDSPKLSPRGGLIGRNRMYWSEFCSQALLGKKTTHPNHLKKKILWSFIWVFGLNSEHEIFKWKQI